MKGAEVRLDGIRKMYGVVAAVDHVSLRVEAGEFVTLLGPSGSGKTTTLACIAGFSIPTEGEIYIDGKRITLEPPFKRNVGMVFQNYALFPHMTVTANLAFPLRMRKLPERLIAERVEWGLGLVQLQGLAGRYPRELSGGEQQRVALARALVFEPPVLLLDEPLGALDKKLRGEMQLELKRLHSRIRVTVIYVTHDQEEALTMSDRIAVMNRGRLEQVGTPLQLYECPATRFVAEFVGESNFFEGTVAIGDGGGCVVVTRSGLRLPIPAGGAQVGEEVGLFLRPEKILITAEGNSEGVRGEVAEVIYIGEATRYAVRTDSGDMVTVKQQNLRPAESLKVGHRVMLNWAPDVAHVHRR
jgi:spermidine/putrescine ABC transporter ATP-binding subunit